jgi:glycyl-tRNA synthetase alpha chain
MFPPMSCASQDPQCLQSLIFQLESFWADKGCVVLTPYDLPMGAGTFHTATTLRTVDDKPWAAAFVQPSRRPQDGRYGDNPNRMQKFFQFQVLIKPAPENAQELLLESFEKIGLSTTKNDIRFVEDDWESPSLGASGLGWEVWCNGMEITQFTYFQKMGGLNCPMISLELTYGLERIALCIQEKDTVFDLNWNPPGHLHSMTYKDLFLQEEKQMSAFYFEYAPIEMLMRHFEEALSLGHDLLLKTPSLVLPAYEQCIQSSHAFNVLDARGAISVSEKARFIQRIRGLAHLCCSHWLELSSSPLSKKEEPSESKASSSHPAF